MMYMRCVERVISGLVMSCQYVLVVLSRLYSTYSVYTYTHACTTHNIRSASPAMSGGQYVC